MIKNGRQTRPVGELQAGKAAKPDLKVNGRPDKLAAAMQKQREKEMGLVPLRIDERTTIFVPPGKCNEEFRRQWMERAKESDLTNW